MHLTEKEREAHILCLGGSNTGKTSWLITQCLQDIRAGRGISVIDPHGDLIDDLLTACFAQGIPSERIVLLDAGDPDRSFRFNPLETLPGRDPYPYVLQICEVFKKLWKSSWGARMEDIMRNCMLALHSHDLTLAEAARFLTDETFRTPLVDQLADQNVKDYWTFRFNPLPQREKRTWCESSLNKLNSFIGDPILRDILGHPQSSINFRELIDSGKIILINLAKGRLKANSYLLGALLVAQIEEAAFSRVDTPRSQRLPHYLYLDEAHAQVPESLVSLLAEVRKFRLSVCLATQTLQQLHDEGLEEIALANTQCQIIFRMSHSEARTLAPQLFPVTGQTTKHVLNQPLFQRLFQPRVQYRSIGEELGEHIQAIAKLKKREAFLHVRGDRTVLIRTLDVPTYSVDPNRFEAYRQQVIDPYTFERGNQRVQIIRDQPQEENDDLSDEDFIWREE